MKIQRNDQVEVIAGKDKGKKGRVLRVFPGESRLLVEHVMMIKKNVKPNPARNIKGGVAEQEGKIHISNVMLLDSEGKKTRVNYKHEGSKKVRVAQTSGETIQVKGKKGK